MQANTRGPRSDRGAIYALNVCYRTQEGEDTRESWGSIPPLYKGGLSTPTFMLYFLYNIYLTLIQLKKEASFGTL